MKTAGTRCNGVPGVGQCGPFVAAARWASRYGWIPGSRNTWLTISDVVDACRRQKRAGGPGPGGRWPPAQKNQETTFPLEMEGGCSVPELEELVAPKTPNGGVVLAQGGMGAV